MNAEVKHRKQELTAGGLEYRAGLRTVNGRSHKDLHFGFSNVYPKTYAKKIIKAGVEVNLGKYSSKYRGCEPKIGVSISEKIINLDKLTDKDNKSNFIFNTLTSMLLNKSYKEVDNIIYEVLNSDLSAISYLSILTSTKPFKAELKFRELLLHKAIEKIQTSYNAKSAERIIQRLS